MHGVVTSAAVLAGMSKHDDAGIAAIVVGIVLVALGALRVAGRTAQAMLIPVAGVVVIIIGILFFTRAL
ncbi:MAG: hypothetical protein JWO62_672 [Acidimicrobiaceae bacterium]|jgi:hypothetical protein|nr:hypothetical protein [Acidimicrobiaceae bacterium]